MKTLIFDFDGTLALTLEATAVIFNQIAPEFDLPQITQENKHLFRDHSVKELLKMYPLSPLKLLKLTLVIQKKLTAQLNEIPAVPDLPEVLDTLHRQGVTLGIVTTNSQVNVDVFLQHHHLEIIDFVLAERNLLGKSAALKKCLKKFQLAKNDVWYIGDEVRDIEAARGAGIKVAAVTWGMNGEERLQKDKPDRIIHRPAELLQLISD